MIDQPSFDSAYDALRADPTWQTGFHDPITDIDDLWNRFLDWVAQVDFGALIGHMLLRILIIAAIALIAHKLGKRWPTLAASRRKKRDRPSNAKASMNEVREQPVDPAALIAEADHLARSSRFLEAISTLFKAGVATANIWHTGSIGIAATAREIGDRRFSPDLQQAFRKIGRSIEHGRFAGSATDAAAYRECRKASECLTDPASWGV